ncbi:isoleucyl-tRNA synthetase [Atractiella rhizophila]|nr:isoleucyl-tRNA synthetase [Atractiella rhizophila]
MSTSQDLSKSAFPAHDTAAPFSFPDEELKVMAYWKEIDAFQESVRQSLKEGRKEFTFYDGPPFATGLPHYGHLLLGTVKDVVTRFAHTNGYHVSRRFGWDTHGLPVEHEIDKKLNITGKADVMAMGIDKYNAECRAIVMRYSAEWRRTVERMGRWIDFDNDYKTLNPSFMETVWWVFKQLWDKDLVYQGVKVMPYSTGLTTPLSNFEAGLDYRDVVDPSVVVSFPLIDDPETSLLAWTTTPWTLFSNMALCVHPEFTYIKIFDEEKKQKFIICDKLLNAIYKDPKKAKFKKLQEWKGKDLNGWRYKPMFQHFYEQDVVTRFAHTNGYHVSRRFGWDTHGLPVEHEIDKKLNITGKADVMAMGIDKYNAECRAIVMRYSAEWRRTVERMGRWIDFDNDYKTLNPSFMETVWWVFKQLWDKDLVYQGVKVMPYSTGLTTPLSNFEAGLDYRDVVDPSVVVSFPLIDDPETSLLAWTTTPWTLFSNMALCVHPEFTYIKIFDEEKKQNFIICDKLLNAIYKDPKKAKFKKLQEWKGKDLNGWRYKPMFQHFYEQYKTKAWKVVNDDYVTSDAGTGIVHQAPAFGEDDHRVCVREGVLKEDEMPPCPINETGKYTSYIPEFEGQYVKDADKGITRAIKAMNCLVHQGTLTHSYPFCWRSGTPLLYRSVPAWFIRVANSTEQLVNNNAQTRWVPQSVSDSRFANWLKNARDWNISRNRYWGTPLPLWASEDLEEIVCVGSLEELNELAGCGILTDLHRETVDKISVPSKKGKGQLRRVEEVFDCWFESGSMPYAQIHYPFENKEGFNERFPADFIAEGLDQTRGWFYTLLVLATLLFDTAPWKNLIVTGIVLAEDGRKMSKSLKNYPDPNEILARYGADALRCVLCMASGLAEQPARLYLINSPVVRGENLRFKDSGVKEVISRALLPWLNSFRFFLGQVELLKKTSQVEFTFNVHAKKSENVMDRWILARCQSLIRLVKTEMEAYRLYTILPRLLGLIDELTNWYIRFNRLRLKGANGLDDTVAALNTLFEALLTLCRTMSSFTPFLTENIYQGLRPFLPTSQEDIQALEFGNDPRSVHFLSFPHVREEYFDPVIERQVTRMQTVIDLGRQARERRTLPLKVPLKEIIVFHSGQEYLDDVQSLSPYIYEELNVQNIEYTTDESRCGVRYRADADWPALGKKLRKDLGKVRKGITELSSDEVKGFVANKKITIEGHELVEGELTTTRYVDVSAVTKAEDKSDYESNTDNDVVILLDALLRPDLVEEGLAREIINRIQRMRKKAGLKTTDDILYYYWSENHQADLDKVLESRKDVLLKVLKQLPEKAKKGKEETYAGKAVILHEEQEVGDFKVWFTLVQN